MNQQEKEEYLREYAILKSQGKPFFPYAVAKDSLMGCIVIAVIIVMSLLFGAQLGPKASGATTTYVPRPDWYFFFLFQLLRVIHPPGFLGAATLGIPTLGMILLFLLPFYDRGPERRPWRRPIAMSTLLFLIIAMAVLTFKGANAGSPTEDTIAAPVAVKIAGPAALSQFYAGRAAVADAGCEACHTIGVDGNPGPGPNLTHVGSRIPLKGIERTLVNPTAPMPSYKYLPPQEFTNIATFISDLK
jgi:ubiquinol-cytochrome c reductase cytochrome b subunit/menaquinol-cytochrome c reductase cytochrome b/c subunit